MTGWKRYGIAAAAALALAPATHADETKRETAATSPQTSTAGDAAATAGDAAARGETPRGAMNQEQHNAKNTPPDSSGASTAATPGAERSGASTAATTGADRKGDATASAEERPSRHDNTDVIKKLWTANVIEIKAAEVAKDKAKGEGVKEFAEKMEKDHGEMRDALAKLAKDRNLDLDEDAALAPHKAHLEQMDKLEGAQFDRHYTRMMVSEHAKDRKDVQAALQRAKKTGDHELAQVLQAADQKMAQHHRLAQSLDKNKGQRVGRRGGDATTSAGARTERGAEKAASSTERGAEKAGSAVKRGAEKTGDAVERGAEKTGEAAKDATR